MSNFTVRRFLLVASMLFCRIALADDSAASAPEPPFKLLAATRPVSMEDVDKVIEGSDRAVQACNKNARRADTLAVLVTMTIEADGTVSAVEAAAQGEDGGKAPAEAACLVRVARRLQFPAAGTVSHVQYPFLIVPRLERRVRF